MKNFESYWLEDQADWLKEKIIKRYRQHGVYIEIRDKDIEILPDRFKFGIKLPGGTRVDDIKKYATDVKMSLKLPLFQVGQEGLDIFIVASKEINNDHSLFRILESPEYAEAKAKMRIAHPIGFDATGKPVAKDLTLYPQAAVCGTTGSGKSVALEILLLSLILMYSPSKVNLIICDMAGDLLQFTGFPHLSCPVIHDFDKFLNAILELREEMERRIPLKGTKEFSLLPRLIFVADEFTSLISGREAKRKLAREVIMDILRRGRHAGIHLILAAHNPTQQRLKLDISDIPTKMAFRVARLSNSMTVLSQSGAEKLLGSGDMLFQSSQADEPQRIQGAYIAPRVLRRVLKNLKVNWSVTPYDNSYKFEISEPDLQQTEAELHDNQIRNHTRTKRDIDEKLFAQIVMWALKHESISCNMIIEAFSIGWKRANGFLNRLHELEIAGELYEKRPRAVLPVAIEDLSPDIVDFLARNGYTPEQVTEILESKAKDDII